jgi:hypothetical protein
MLQKIAFHPTPEFDEIIRARASGKSWLKYSQSFSPENFRGRFVGGTRWRVLR